MITIQRMRFRNVLSYGEDNTIDFTVSAVTQLIGKNGHGKSSIATILEEALYNKNSRGISKSELVNRYTEDKKYSIEVDFDKNGTQYTVVKNVASSAKVDLLEDGVSIAGHTATQTYKIIEGIIGADFNTFTKLVNQSMKSSLDFLSATDSVRKKFLIDLIGLEEYGEAEKKVKEELKQVTAELNELEGAKSYIEKELENATRDAKAARRPIPDLFDHTEEVSELTNTIAELTKSLESLEKTNAAARDFNRKVDQLENLAHVEKVLPEDTAEVVGRASELRTKLSHIDQELKKLKGIKTDCPTCKRPFDDVPDMSEDIDKLNISKSELSAEIQSNQAETDRLSKVNSAAKRYETYAATSERLLQELGGTRVRKEIQNAADISADLDSAKLKKQSMVSEFEKTKKLRADAEKHNARVDIAAERVVELEAKLKDYTDTKLVTLVEKLKQLRDVFGTKGLVSYKIESSIKVFEALINEYLVKLSDGQFAISFVVSEAKLEVVLYDSGELINIKSVSSGELNKINTATLLAFRKLMSAVAKTNINLLFIDEVSSVLDGDSRDELTELLLQEAHLNSMMVTHEYSHPLTNKINVVKENRISRIEDGQ
jgi:DNA repair exonuclease SbcCD ATPase subunit